MEDHGDMPIEDFTHGLYRNVLAIKIGIFILIAVEMARFVL